LHASPRPKYGVFAPIFCPSGVAAFGRDVESSKQVWSAIEGYPGDPDYREFYRDIGFDLPLEYLSPLLGEAQYRLSSEILNNQSGGMGRFWREFGAFLVDPVRGFNRLLSGDASAKAKNPTDAMDWRPEGSRTMVATGFRSIGEGSSITNNTKSYATLLLNHTYGDVWENTRRKPFDYIEFVGEINFGEKVGLSNVQIRGDLASWLIGTEGNHALQFVQYFDYINNNAYEFGGQSVGVALSSRFRLSDRFGLATRVDATSDDRLYLQAPVSSKDAAAGRLVILGITVQTGSGTEYRDSSGAAITAAAFFDLVVVPRTVVKARSRLPMSGSTLSADQVEIEGSR